MPNFKFVSTKSDSAMNVVFLMQDEKFPEIYKELDAESGGMISSALSDENIFKAKYGAKKTLTYSHNKEIKHFNHWFKSYYINF